MTEMKPEYHYSTTPRFCVELLPDTIMTNRTGILRVIRRTKPEYRLMKLAELHQRYRDSDVVMQWIFNRQDEKNKLIQLLNAANATFRQKHLPVPIIFPADGLYDRLHADMVAVGMGNEHYSLFEVRSRYTLGQANAVVRGYSEALAHLSEYALPHWARANQIIEAYRFTQITSTYEPHLTLRLWWTPKTIHAIYHEVSSSSVVTYLWQVTPADWAQIRAFMARHFWTVESWYSINPDHEFLPRTIFVFEGWRGGVYRFLDDSLPKSQHVSYQAVQLFRRIIDTYKQVLP